MCEVSQSVSKKRVKYRDAMNLNDSGSSWRSLVYSRELQPFVSKFKQALSIYPFSFASLMSSCQTVLQTLYSTHGSFHHLGFLQQVLGKEGEGKMRLDVPDDYACKQIKSAPRSESALFIYLYIDLSNYLYLFLYIFVYMIYPFVYLSVPSLLMAVSVKQKIHFLYKNKNLKNVTHNSI